MSAKLLFHSLGTSTATGFSPKQSQLDGDGLREASGHLQPAGLGRGVGWAKGRQGAAVGQCLHLSPQGLQMRPSEPPLPSGLQAAATSVHRVVAVAASEVPVTRGAAEGKHVLIRHGLEPSE